MVGSPEPFFSTPDHEYRRAGLWGDASVLDWFHLAVLSSGGKDAVVDRLGTSLTFRELDAESSRLATWMIERGVNPGDVVGIQLPNWADFTVIYVACMKAGAVINAIPTNLRLAELSQICTMTKAVMMFHPTKFRHTEFEGLALQLKAKCPSIKDSVLVDRLGVEPRDLWSFDHIVRTSRPLERSRERVSLGADLAAILFTSGSEAEPKGVMLSHNNLIASERAFASTLNITWSDRMFMPAPVGHATGFLHGVTMPLISQITSVLCDVSSGSEMVKMLRRTEATGGMAVPALAEAILDECVASECRLPALRFLCCGGSPVPRALVVRARGYGISLYSVYGSTESAPHTMTTFCDDEDRVVNTDGRACWGTRVKVVDPVTREEVPVGTPGEEVSRGPAVFMGYLGRPDLTARAIDEDGWYYSGDLCVMDEGGYIRITGRLKDIVIRGGENISVAEVEQVLCEHPRVKEAAVIGIEDPALGQRLCACIVSRDGKIVTVSELCDHFVSRNFAKFKIPEKVVMLQEMPRTSSDKISKRELRNRFAAGVPAGYEVSTAV